MTKRRRIVGALGGLAGIALMFTTAVAQPPTATTPSSPAPRAASPAKAGPVAVVNGEPIPAAELDALMQAVPRGPTEVTAAQEQQTRQEALDMLVDDVLIRQFLAKSAPKVAKAEIDKEFHTLLNSLKIRNTTYEAFLRDTHQTDAHLRQDIVKKLQWDKYLRQNVSDAEVKKYYDAYRAFYDQVTVRVSHILMRFSPDASEGERAQTRAKLAELRRRIVATQLTFEDAAQQFSQCPSASRGGDIGVIMRKWVVDERIARAAFALKVGDVSDVVETESGVELLKVTHRNPGQPSDFEKIKELVRENLGMEYLHNILVHQRQIAKIETHLH